MDLTLDSRERDMLSTARSLMQKVLGDGARLELEDQQSEATLRDVIRTLARDGWLTAHGPEAPLFDRAPFFAAAGEALVPGLVSTAIAGGTLLGAAEHGLRSAVESGECLLTIADTSTPPTTRTQTSWTAEQDQRGRFHVRGTLGLVEYGAVADAVVILADNPSSAAPIALVVDLGQPGVERLPRPTFGNDFRADLRFNIVVRENDIIDAELGTGPVADIIASCTAIRLMECGGAARAVTRRTVEYVNMRHQFGKPLAQFQAVKQHAADMLILSEGAFLLAAEALADTGIHGGSAPTLWEAAAWVPRAYKDVTLWAHQLHGGMGYARESHLFRWSERAKLRELEIESLLTPARILAGLGGGAPEPSEPIAIG